VIMMLPLNCNTYQILQWHCVASPPQHGFLVFKRVKADLDLILNQFKQIGSIRCLILNVANRPIYNSVMQCLLITSLINTCSCSKFGRRYNTNCI